MFDESFSHTFEVVLFFAVLVSSLFSLFLFTLPAQYDPYKDRTPTVSEDDDLNKIEKKEGDESKEWKAGKTTYVVVLGDIGRSPRMQYHALSIAKHRGRVYLIGYQGSSYENLDSMRLGLADQIMQSLRYTQISFRIP